ncbi:MAG: sensor histidine kinase, partial [Lachnospiraceae bacterium]|nr:sensor histidine kinase [Lachnospiraceae bacterium]
ENGNAVVSFRNVSRDPLSLSPDEIAERFTRGDSSRNTEGSGLGLSICKSLVDLQGGSQNIYIDGDLFKVVLAFPLITGASEA